MLSPRTLEKGTAGLKIEGGRRGGGAGGVRPRGIEGKIAPRGTRASATCRSSGCASACRARDRVRPARGRHGGANSTEFDPETPYPVIDLMPDQRSREWAARCAWAPTAEAARRHARARIYGDA